MNYLTEQNQPNRRNNLWKEYCPFYLDYYDSLQCGFSVSFFDWIKTKKTYDDRWDRYFILAVNTNNSQSSFELINVLCPNETEEYEPEELVNVNGNLIRFC